MHWYLLFSGRKFSASILKIEVQRARNSAVIEKLESIHALGHWQIALFTATTQLGLFSLRVIDRNQFY